MPRLPLRAGKKLLEIAKRFLPNRAKAQAVFGRTPIGRSMNAIIQGSIAGSRGGAKSIRATATPLAKIGKFSKDFFFPKSKILGTLSYPMRIPGIPISTKLIAGGVLGKNIAEAAVTGNIRDLTPSRFETGLIIGSPFGAFGAAVGGVIGQLTKTGRSARQEIGEFFDTVGDKIPDSIKNIPNFIIEQGDTIIDFPSASGSPQAIGGGGAPIVNVSPSADLGGRGMPDLETMALLLGIPLAVLLTMLGIKKLKKKKRKKYKRRKR